MSSGQKVIKIKRIVQFCKKEFKSLAEISEELDGINKNTLRSSYLYPMYKEGILIRNANGVRKAVKYRAK
jgi:hypothetical protein